MNLQVDVFAGKEASVNSYLFNNGQSMVVMDVLRNSHEAAELAETIKKKGLPLSHVLISHGHPDHYIGMDVMSKSFPEAKIVVASPEIKADIMGFSAYMETIGWLESEPTLKPKTANNPQGFDYENRIEVLSSSQLTLHGGGTLEIRTDYDPAEAEHLSTVFSKDLNALFTSDFCYNGVHLWLGPGVDSTHIANWKSQLYKLKETYGHTDVTIYPGHGQKSTPALFDTVLKYIADFEETISAASSKDEAMAQMRRLYPEWLQDDFLLLFSVDFHMGLKEVR
ncbi:MAG: MBL fold metallo-hydrolase [Bacteroidota bacterium]